MSKYPKSEKKLTWFLSKNSKATLSALILWGQLISSAWIAQASVSYSINPALPYPSMSNPIWSNSSHASNAATAGMTVVTAATCSHASGTVNGHYSAIPAVSSSQQIYTLTSHGSHWSHGSHCSGCCCCDNR